MSHQQVLFLCTGNSARSILAEACLSRMGAGRFRAYSAGSKPIGKVNPFALQFLEELGHGTDQYRSKTWDEFSGGGAPNIDYVITVCDNAAGETCPVWYGTPTTAHWGLPDPAAVSGSDMEKRLAFAKTYALLADRIGAFINVVSDPGGSGEMVERIRAIGRLPGGTVG